MAVIKTRATGHADYVREGSPDGGGSRAAFLAEVPDCLRGELLGLAVLVRNRHQSSSCRRPWCRHLPTSLTLPPASPATSSIRL